MYYVAWEWLAWRTGAAGQALKPGETILGTWGRRASMGKRPHKQAACQLMLGALR